MKPVFMKRNANQFMHVLIRNKNNVGLINFALTTAAFLFAHKSNDYQLKACSLFVPDEDDQKVIELSCKISHPNTWQLNEMKHKPIIIRSSWLFSLVSAQHQPISTHTSQVTFIDLQTVIKFTFSSTRCLSFWLMLWRMFRINKVSQVLLNSQLIWAKLRILAN